MTTETETPRGGADWELGEAARKLTEAMTSGDAAAIEAALRDHAAAVGSKSTQMISALFVPLMTELRETREDVAQAVKLQVETDSRSRQSEQSYQTLAGYVYKTLGAFFRNTDARNAQADERDQRIDRTLAAMEEAVRGLGGLTAQIAALDARDTEQHEESKRDRAALHQRLDDQAEFNRGLAEQLQQIQELLAARPEQRRIEHEQLLEALQRDRGDGNT